MMSDSNITPRMSTWKIILNISAVIGGIDIAIIVIKLLLNILFNYWIMCILCIIFRIIFEPPMNDNQNQNNQISQYEAAKQDVLETNPNYKAAKIVYKAITGDSLADMLLYAAVDEDIASLKKKAEKKAKKEAKQDNKNRRIEDMDVVDIYNCVVHDMKKGRKKKNEVKPAIKENNSGDVLLGLKEDAALDSSKENHVAKDNNLFSTIFKKTNQKNLDNTKQREKEDFAEAVESPLNIPRAPLPRLSYQDVLKEIEKERLESLRKSYNMDENISEEITNSSETFTSTSNQQISYPNEETFRNIPAISTKIVSNGFPENRQRGTFNECFSEPPNELENYSEEDKCKTTKKKSFLRRKFSKLKKSFKISRKNSITKVGSSNKPSSKRKP